MLVKKLNIHHHIPLVAAFCLTGESTTVYSKIVENDMWLQQLRVIEFLLLKVKSQHTVVMNICSGCMVKLLCK